MISNLINFYLSLYVIVLIAGTAGYLIRLLGQRKLITMKSSSELKLNYTLLCFCLILPFISFLKVDSFQFEPVVKIESAVSMKALDPSPDSRDSSAVKVFSKALPNIEIDQLFSWSLGFVLLSGILGLGKILIDVGRLVRILKNSYPIRQIGSIRISASDQIQVPFSARVIRSWVLIPTEMISQKEIFKISVLHEIQHHRQRDTSFIYLLLGMKAFLLLNPMMWLWNQAISEIQEMACDENLLEQKRVSREVYAGRLVEIAETAIGRKGRLVCAAGLGFLSDRQTLIRRIESMFQEEKKTGILIHALGICVVIAMAGSALASRELVLDQRVTMQEAQKMVEVAKTRSDFPVMVNDLVLKQLNRFLGTEDGRQFIRDSVERMRAHQPMLDTKLSQYRAPTELLAIGIAESGFQNLPQSANKSWGAGIWMFIESTAKKYGLRVDSVIDERLNTEKETDAAMRYLTSNNLRFKNWLLAIQAYNTGENRVQKAIDEEGTRDVWALIRAGLPSDKDYLAKVMAIVLILKNPEVLN